MLPLYAELHCRSNFSFLTGASHPEELVERAQALGYSALAITDECSVAGVVRAHVEAQRCGLHLIIGTEMRLTQPGSGAPHARLVLLAQTRRGYGNLSHWITVARRRVEKGHYRAHPGDIEGKVPNAPTLTGLPDCLALLVPDASQPFEIVYAHAMWLKTWFGERAAIAIELLHRAADDDLVDLVQRVADYAGLPIVAAGDVLMHVRSRKPLQDTLTATRLNMPVAQCGLQLAPNAEQHLRSRGRLAALYEPAWLENTLRLASQCRFSLSELKYEYPQEIVPPGETPTSHLRKLTYAGVPKRFPGGLPDDIRQQIEHELALIEQLKYEPYFLTVADIVRWARAQGILCQGRGSAANSVVCYCLDVTEVDPARASLLFERFISAERNEPPDIDIDFEHQRREEVIQYIYRKYGRHRAALTAVVICYRPRSAVRDAGRALGIDLQRIDAVSKGQHWFDGRSIGEERLRENGFDPDAPITRLWMELTNQLIGFPRHLSQHPGGFVIARDQIEQLVPVENAAMLAPRGGMANIEGGAHEGGGDDFAHADEDIDAANGDAEWMNDGDDVVRDGARHHDAAAATGEPVPPASSEPLRFAPGAANGAASGAANGAPRGTARGAASGNASGTAIGVASGVASGAGNGSASGAALRDAPYPALRSVVQWDKDDLDALGLIKVDVLALGMLSALRRSLELIGRKLGRRFEMQDIPDADKPTYDMISRADTVGVFQIESRAQMSMLPRLRPQVYYDLVVQVAIVRPGPIQGGMVHPYLRNRGIPDEQIDCPAEIRPALMRTKGVPIFQEQVMQIAMLAADFTPGEADQLRRAMAAWKRKGGLSPFHQRLVGRMVEKGYSRDYAESIFKQIQGFGEYGFPESHAAGFALIAYDSSWVKRHHPDAFLAGLLNSQPMGFYAPAQLVRDAREHGVEVRPVDVRVSVWDCTLEDLHGDIDREAGVEAGERDERHDHDAAARASHVADHADADAAAETGTESEAQADVESESHSGSESAAATDSESESHAHADCKSNLVPAACAPQRLPVHAPLRAVRLGLNRISGLSEDAANRIVQARIEAPLTTVEDLARRAALNAHELRVLAEADALRGITGHRHQAAWAVAGIDTRPTEMLRATRLNETAATLSSPTEVENMLADYGSLGLTLNRHPLALLREELARYKVQPAAVLRGYPNGRLARASGLVTHRQQPGTAKGTVFVTLEDETGAINVIVWPTVVAAQRKPLLAAKLLTVYGRWQREGEVMHLVATKLVDHSALLQGLHNKSRDFR